jgi:hypothetical protein
MDWNHNAFSSWGKIKHGVPHISILGPSLFLIYRKVLPKIINNKSKPILLADPCPIDFKNDIYTMWIYNKWFKVKLLSFNFDKTQYIQFITGNSSFIYMKIGYNNDNLITNVSNAKISWNSYRKYMVLEN